MRVSGLWRPWRSWCRSLQYSCPKEEILDRKGIKSAKGKSLIGKNVAYVGGYGGIGYACCKKLVHEGIKHLVILDLKENCRKRRCLHLVNPSVKLNFVPLNLCEGREAIDSALSQVMKHMGCIDILINGSGILNDRDPETTLQVNLTGLIDTTFAAIPLMSTTNNGKGGLIANVSCVFGLEPGAFAAIYSASKHAVVGFTRSLAHDVYLQHTGIVHTAICPGPTATEMFTSFLGRDTFHNSKALSDVMITAQTQSTEACGLAMVKVIKRAENGAIWIINLGTSKRVKFPQYWHSAKKQTDC